MQQMINFLKDVYLTGFTIVYKTSRARKSTYRAGSAIGVITVLQGVTLIGIKDCFEIHLNHRFVFPKPAIIIAIFVLYFLNQYFLFIRGHGVKFADKYVGFKKVRKVILITSCLAFALSCLVFVICAAITHHRFINAH